MLHTFNSLFSFFAFIIYVSVPDTQNQTFNTCLCLTYCKWLNLSSCIWLCYPGLGAAYWKQYTAERLSTTPCDINSCHESNPELNPHCRKINTRWRDIETRIVRTGHVDGCTCSKGQYPFLISVTYILELFTTRIYCTPSSPTAQPKVPLTLSVYLLQRPTIDEP